MIPDQNFHGDVFANTIIKSVKNLGPFYKTFHDYTTYTGLIKF